MERDKDRSPKDYKSPKGNKFRSSLIKSNIVGLYPRADITKMYFLKADQRDELWQGLTAEQKLFLRKVFGLT